MITLHILTVITAFFVLSGLVLCGMIIWMIVTRRDQLYQAKYQRFLEQRRRVTSKLRTIEE